MAGWHLLDVAVRPLAEDLPALAVHGKDLPAEAEAEQVVERGEPELPGMARRARDDHAARVEERPEACAQRLGRGQGSRRGGRPGRTENDQRVDRHWLPVTDDQGVHVDARHVRAFEAETAECHEDRGERGDVERGLATKRLEEKAARRERVDHPSHVGRRRGRRREGDVTERLGHDAAEPDQHARSEGRVAHQAGDQLAMTAHLLGDQHLHGAILGPAEREEVGRRRPHRARVREAETDEPPLGLVRDRVAAQLRDHGEAEGFRRAPRFVSAVDDRLARHWNAVADEQRLRGVLGESRARHVRRNHCVLCEGRQGRGLPPRRRRD